MNDLDMQIANKRRKCGGRDPKKIGVWKIGRTIGTGSSGRVRIARNSKTGQYAAVKIMSKTALNSQVSLNRLADEVEHKQLAIEREIVVMKLIDHPNIMRLYDVWETSTELFLILEYIQGGELFEYLCEKGRLPTGEALDYFQQIISAVDYCHRFNIAHRDLKPENILLDQNRNVKIADFGMAAWQANKQDGLLYTSCGSPHYAAPEIINGEPYNGSAADIWSCGIILYALLSGRLPFDDEDCSILLAKVTLGEYVMPSDINPLAQDLIRQMLTTDVGKRITMANIQKHPFYVSRKPKLTGHAMPNLDDIARPIGSASSIDPDIFANLRTLWHGTPDQDIVQSLLNEERNWQKGIYHLLVECRRKHAEIREEVNDNGVVLMKNKSKRAKSKTSDKEVRSTTHGAPRASAFKTHDTSPESESSFSESVAHPPITVRECYNGDIRQLADHLNARFETTALSVCTKSPDLDKLNGILALQIRDTNPTAIQDTKHAKEPLSVRWRNKVQRQAISLPLGEKENETRQWFDDENGVKRRSGHALKRVQIVEPREKRTNKLKKVTGRTKDTASPSPPLSDCSRSAGTFPGTASPVRCASPKRSWLASVFKIKSMGYSLMSTRDIHTTRNECRRLIMAMGAKVMLDDVEGLGVLRCRLDEGTEGARGIKFRVEVQPATDEQEGYSVCLLVVHEKGSVEGFKRVFSCLREGWTAMDGERDGGADRFIIPAGSFGGGLL
ncbi:hypothetical protein AX17_003600 [Amanita inopinata Kibby_2008]|nr:hypothetical protein AX17_003600 [Amanita inopinata Kibby_2008]